jgi:hypothetical protein
VTPAGPWDRRLPATGLLALGLAWLLAAPAPAAAGSFRVESHLAPREVGVDGLVHFTIEVEGPGFEQPRLRPRFRLENLEVVGGADHSHGITVGTGGSGWRYSWTWRLRPQAVGPAAVLEVHLLVGDREVDLAPQRLEVLATSLPGAPGSGAPSWRSDSRNRFEELLSQGFGRFRRAPRAGAAGEPALFLQATASPVHPYVGERVVYTVFLYTRVPVRAMEPESLPTFQGLWARPVELEPAPRELVDWQGETYTRVALLRKELFALASRRHVVEPVRARFVVDRVDPGRSFFSPVRVPVEVVRESNPVALEVRPLPDPGADLAPSFTGAVGALDVAAALGPTEVAVGQGATLTVTAAGDGHLEAMAAPRVETPPGLDVIGPQSGAPAGGEASASARSWSYLLVPRRPGSWQLPAIEVPYFDPGSGDYRLARAVLPALVARGSSPAAAAPAPPAGGARATAARPLPGSPAPALAASRWLPLPSLALAPEALPWALTLPGLAALLLILVRRRRAGGRDSGLGGLRRRLDAARREERPRRAAAAIERAWRDFLIETRGLPEALPPARWPDELVTRGAPREACRDLRELLDDLHYLRFAPELAATVSLTRELADRSERVAQALGG